MKSDTKLHHIYIIQNKLNLKVYIGYSSRPENRWKEHERKARKGINHPLYDAMRRYGLDNFTKQIIETFDDKKEALEAEKFWIEYFRSNRIKFGNEYGYNLHEGGGVPPNHLGKKMSETQKKNIGNANRGKPSWMKGKVSPRKDKKGKSIWTEEQRKQISENLKGHPVSLETRNKISKANKGKLKGVPRSEETKRKISIKHKGKKLTKEHRQKLSDIKKGKKSI